MTLPMVNNQSFKNWLRKQEPAKVYSYFDNKNCLICKYFHSYGYSNVSVNDEFYMIDGTAKTTKKIPEGWNAVAMAGNDGDFSLRTYGDAYNRAMELLD